ncbi:MAG: HTH domain-containing protein [Prevotella sp.]|nr:HTH domain-containing protein [Prevotella sp.]
MSKRLTSEDKRYILHHRYELSQADIARELGVSRSAICTFLKSLNKYN